MAPPLEKKKRKSHRRQEEIPTLEKLRTPPLEKKKRKSHRRQEEVLTLEKLRTLGRELLSSRSHINNLPLLLSALSPSSPLDFSIEALISLQSFFLPVLPEIPSSSCSSNADEKDPESVYGAWLRARFDEFVRSLVEIAVSADSEEALRDLALDAIMDFVKTGKEGKFQTAIYHLFLYNIVNATSSVNLLLDLLASKYFKFIDVRYFTYTSLDKIARDCEPRNMIGNGKKGSFHNGRGPSESRMENSIRIIYNILSCIPPLEILSDQTSYDMWSQLAPSSKEPGEQSSKTLRENVKPKKSNGMNNKASSVAHIVKKYKLKFSKAWLSFLKLPLPLDVYKEVLATLHQNVIPYISDPAILCDFLTRSYDIGGVISVMALNGLFILMTEHGLEYPKFYEKLYLLLTPAVFMAKHRARFFPLLDTCLKSSHLPAYLAAAFAKKLSRLALSVPPSGELVIIALIHNLLRRHPSINFLVHQQMDDGVDGEASVEGGVSGEVAEKSIVGLSSHSKKHGLDPFVNEERDPVKSNAMRSSLWEIDTLRHHYCPAVSRFVASLENDLTVRAKTSEITVADFSSSSYATIFREETRRRIKQVPIAFYSVTPSRLFSESDFPGWTFEDVHLNSEKGAKKARIESS